MFKTALKLFIVYFSIGLISCSEETVDEFRFGQLTGKVVTEGDNVPLENVKITTNPVSTTVFTDANGEFNIPEIKVDDYSVQAELKDYLTEFESAPINIDLTTNVVFELDLADTKNIAPSIPNLISPIDKANDIETSVNFTWSSGINDDDEITYNFELRNENGEVLNALEKLTDTILSIENLEVGTNYFWQVQAVDGINPSVQSALSAFKTRGIGDNRFLYARNIGGNSIIYSGGEPIASVNDQGANQNEVRLTSENINSYRPRKNNTVEKIAFLRNVGAENHLFTMNFDGSNIKQISNEIPVTGFRQTEVDYAWSSSGDRIFYPHLNKIYAIQNDGSANVEIYRVAEGRFITEIAINGVNNLMVVKTNNANGYNARIVIVNPDTDTEEQVVLEGETGALGGIDYSFDGGLVLYTRDVNGGENDVYRQLDTRIFEFNTQSLETTEFLTRKESGMNDLDPVYTEDGGAVIFVGTSNDGISIKNIYRVVREESQERVLLFTDAIMPEF
jgi:hypothetical protein